MAQLTGKNIVGHSLSAEGSIIFRAENPANGKNLEPGFHEASEKEIWLAIEKASTAFGVYRRKSGSERAAFLEAIAEEITALGDDLINRCIEETGLPEARLKGERGRTVNQLKIFAAYLREGSWVEARVDKEDPTRTPPKPDIRSMQMALGPVGVFGASNFPLAFSVAGGDTTSALAAGCPVVFKAHPAHPGTCELVGMAIIQAAKKTGMPEGTFSMVHGKSTVVGLAIVRHPLIKAIGFTGSFRGGKALFDVANSRPVPIPVYAEMGSTNPVFILPQALRERRENIAKDLAASVTLGVGQFCTNPGLVFYQGDAEKSFGDSVARSLQQITPGVMLTSSIQEAYYTGVNKLSSTSGVKTLFKGDVPDQGSYAAAYLFQTSADAFLNDHSLEEEVFGPSTLTVPVDDKSQLLRIASQLGGHLTATIHATEGDLQEFAELITILEQKVGRIIINGYPTGVEVTHAMVHGGPYPATTDSRSTSVGTDAIKRFARPVCFQNFPQTLLPAELRDENPLGILRMVNGKLGRE
ncbi:MAG TPA: aldehyde dehydrogenase (NADP(+)) [Chryseosolibacter sp.]|nr:aldehyde dehydrogenase (NADP(+)) [Chryseosolibacter sp.]